MNVIRCNNINYRKGYIEVEAGIHENCINIEATGIHPDKDITNINLGDGKFSDEDFTGNTELELSLSEAEKLIDLLKTAISNVRGQSNSGDS